MMKDILEIFKEEIHESYERCPECDSTGEIDVSIT